MVEKTNYFYTELITTADKFKSNTLGNECDDDHNRCTQIAHSLVTASWVTY